MRAFSKGHLAILAAGIVLGIVGSSLWPTQQAYSVTVDRDSKESRFAMTTVEIMDSTLSGNGLEGVFVLDFLTGRLTGGILNGQQGAFQHSYRHNVARDFKIDAKTEPRFAIVTGVANLRGRNGGTPAAGIIYVAELTSGKVAAYAIPYRNVSRGAGKLQAAELRLVDMFTFRGGA